jgi:hypothetical protein
MWIVITTFKGSEYLQRLLKTIPQVAHGHIITVSQKEDEDSIIGHTVKLKRNIYEYGGFVGVNMLVECGTVSRDDWFFMIHDTCEFTPSTLTNLEFIYKTIHNTNINLYYLLNGRFHNLCLCRRDGIVKKFQNVTSMTKQEALEHEGKIHEHEGCEFSSYFQRSIILSDECRDDGRHKVMVESVHLIKWVSGLSVPGLEQQKEQ